MDPTQTGQNPTHKASGTFPRSVRLTRPADFEQTLRHPEFRMRSGPLRIAVVQNRMHTARLGLIVGKKAIAQAHARNRVKRIIRDRFRRAQTELGNIDLVVRVAEAASASEVHAALDSLFTDLEKKALENSADS